MFDTRRAHLFDYWGVVRKRIWFVLSIVTVIVGVAAVVTMMTDPIYVATARIQIERAAPNVMPFQEVVSTAPDYFSFYATQEALISSRTVAGEVVDSLKLQRKTEFAAFQPPEDADDDAREALRERLIDVFLSRLTVAPVEGSLFDIAYRSKEPRLAARIANRTAEAFINFTAESRYSTTERATKTLETQIADLREDLEAQDQAIRDYARDNGILLFSEGQDAGVRTLKELRAALIKAQTDRIEKEARYAALQQADPSELPELLRHDVIHELTTKLAQQEARRAELSSRVKPDWPEMVRLEGEIQEMTTRLEAERQDLYHTIVGAAENDYIAARNQEAALAAAIGEEEARFHELSERQLHYENLRVELQEKQETLNALVRRQSETTTLPRDQTGTSNVRIVDHAVVPNRAVSPRVALNLALSLVLGLVLGVGLAFFLDYLDLSVKTPEEARDTVDLAVIGVIPGNEEVSRIPRLVRRRQAPPREDERGNVSMARPLSAPAEAFRDMRTALLVSQAAGPPRTILVTSTEPGDGKTFVAINLAVSLAQAGRRTLLVDSDLRKPRAHAALGLFDQPGLSTYLSAESFSGVRPQRTRIPHLDFVASGPLPPNPADLLDSDRFSDLLRQLSGRGNGVPALPGRAPGEPPLDVLLPAAPADKVPVAPYDHVILDSPPVLAVADPSIIASRAEGVIMVVRAGVTGRAELAEAVEKLRQVHARLLGLAVNGVHSDRRYYGKARAEEAARASSQTAESVRQRASGA
ncbi:MAG: GNVR domain-containing protein [Acidobacteriota bacterium]|jgi:uncharacterized protein involved in exopolysaccharide biosynthesis/Mrp family chromosome partitioning ATPase